jgi:molecular chaperone GrpE
MTKKSTNDTEKLKENPAADEQPLHAEQNEELLKKITDLETEIAGQKQQAEKFHEELLRRAAEFENFRKQKEREVMMAGTRTLENVIRELLPMLDDLKRVIDHTPAVLENAPEAKPFVDGVELLRKNFGNWLEAKGVKAIEAKGQMLDVNFHEAISQIDHPDSEPDTIVEEYQTGYVLGERVIRHAKVIVAR